VGHPIAELRCRLFGIDPRETTFERRGFKPGKPTAVAQLERVGVTFVEGYHAALRAPDVRRLGDTLNAIDRDWQGFAFEGAGMALALLDHVTPWSRQRLTSFLAGPGAPHVYMVTIGAGWAWARLGRWLARVDQALARLDPILGWLALDGFGFHEGYFFPDRTVGQQTRPVQIRGDHTRIFDQGLGRSLWFVCGADPDRLAAEIGKFAADRQSDLWSGSGLACTYACGASEHDIDRLVELSGPHRASLAQGAAFAAKARERAGSTAPQTEIAVSRICGTSPELASKLCDRTLANRAEANHSKATGPMPSSVEFEGWRADIRQEFERSFAAEEA